MDGPNAQIPQLVARMDPLPRVGRGAAKWRRFSRLPLPSRLAGIDLKQAVLTAGDLSENWRSATIRRVTVVIRRPTRRTFALFAVRCENLA
jgi:hypothetical protein